MRLAQDEILEVVARRIAVAMTDSWGPCDERDVLAWLQDDPDDPVRRVREIYNDLERAIELLQCLPSRTEGGSDHGE